MFNKFCLIITLILLSYSNFVYSNPKNAIGEDQKTVKILNNYFSKQSMVGKANFQFLFWNMYDDFGFRSIVGIKVIKKLTTLFWFVLICA